MIPFNPAIFLIMAIIKLIALATPFLWLYSLLFALRVFFIARKEQVPFFRLLFKSKFFIVVLVITLIFSGITWYTSAEEKAFKADYTTRSEYQKQRRNFVLEHDHLYGEFLFPKGTLINRYDPSDNGDETYPLILSGLKTAEFPEPTEIAGILATKLDAMGYVVLAEDQDVGPRHYYSRKTHQWTEDRTMPFMACEKGMVAIYEKPSGPGTNYDEEFWWRDKDGAEAHFKPSQWQFRYCEHATHRVEMLPAYGSEEAVARELAEQKAKAERKSQTIIRDGVLMDAEEVTFTISYLMEAQREYIFTARSSQLEADYLKAYRLFEKAAENEEAEAYYYLGIMNDAGEGVPQDREKALYWLHKSANAGNVDAVAKIGGIYLNDEAVQDYAKAMEIFQRAANTARNEVAEFYIGLIYAQGLGVTQDYQQALAWFRKAADPIHAIGMTGYHHLSLNAMLNVGKIYEQGLVGEKDPKAAEPWYDKACHLKLEEACERLEGLEISESA